MLCNEFAASMQVFEHFGYQVVGRGGACRHANPRTAREPFGPDVLHRFDEVRVSPCPFRHFDQAIRVGAVSGPHDQNHLRSCCYHLDRGLAVLRCVTDVLITRSDKRRKSRP